MASKAAEVSDVKARKKSAFSCENCRRRKVKCSGEQPACKRCVIRKDECLYKLGPTLSYTQKLETEIEDLKRQLDHRDSLRLPAIFPARPDLPGGGEGLFPRGPGNDVDRRTDYDGLRLDQRGSTTFHGPTSFFQRLPRGNVDGSIQPPAPGPQLPKIEMQQRDPREQLVFAATQQRALETQADTPEPYAFLLQSHWCWINPLFNFVYRPAFTRDMERIGQYYSHMLLNTMLSHSVRWCKSDPTIQGFLVPFDGGSLFGRHARQLLSTELIQEGSSSIPTIQTLLLMSAQESSKGNQTQAWLYSGMAFRLVEDMGINLDSRRFSGSVQLSDEDIEIRRRLFWSCYFYDKIISLYFGRSPSIRHSHVNPPQIMLDDSAENELWVPHGIQYAKGREYPPTIARSISCFMRMCQLSLIMNEILVNIYNPFYEATEEQMDNCLQREGHAMRVWWAETPATLRIEPRELPLWCPPSHIVTLNCLYHTFNILLYRPMLSRKPNTSRRQRPEHLVECVDSARSIVTIFDLFVRTFGDSHCVLSLSYSIYTAASIFLLQVQADRRDEHAFKRLDFCMHSLDRVRGANPVIACALGNIVQELMKLGIPIAPQFRPRASKPAMAPVTPMNPSSPFGSSMPSTSIATPIATPSPASIPALEGINFEDFQVTPEMFEAYSMLEPMSAQVGGMASVPQTAIQPSIQPGLAPMTSHKFEPMM